MNISNNEIKRLKKISKNNAHACMTLAKIYYDKKDVNKFIQWLQKAGEIGNIEAQHDLGVMYSEGEYVEQDMNEAIYWWKKAAEQGDAESIFNLAKICLDGVTITDGEKINKGIKLLESSAEKGFAEAQSMLGEVLFMGYIPGIEKNQNKGIYWWEKAAEQGYVDSCYNLGSTYSIGDGVDKDYNKSEEYYKKALENGCKESYLSLGNLYSNKEWDKYNINEAIKWFEKGIEAGNQKCQTNLGGLYAKHEDYENAKKLLEPMAGNNDMVAQNVLARIYIDEKKYTEGIDLLKESAEQGNGEAQHGLCEIYSKGQIIELDFEEAAKWLKKSVEQGHAPAQNDLAMIYLMKNHSEEDFKQLDNNYREPLFNSINSIEQLQGLVEVVSKEQSLDDNYIKSEDLFKKALRQDSLPAKINYHDFYDKKYNEEQLKQLADDGDDVAQCCLAIKYANSDNIQGAKKLFEESAGKDNVLAQYNLGKIYYNESKADKKKVLIMLHYWEKSASQGYAEAQYALGEIYYRGIMIGQNLELAADWWLKAAEQGNRDAKLNLSSLIIRHSSENYYKRAVKWLEELAQLGNSFAYTNLGIAYFLGRGIDKNIARAVICWRRGVVHARLEDIQMYNEMILEQDQKSDLIDFMTIALETAKILHGQMILKDEKDKKDFVHFTKSHVFYAVFSNDNGNINPLRLSDIRFCNDELEGKVLFNELGIELPEDLEDYYPLITCFCRGDENHYMWNEYGENLQGAALHFDNVEICSEERQGKESYAFERNKSNRFGITPMAFNVIYLPKDKDLSNLEDKKILESLEKIKDILNNLSDELKINASMMLIELGHIIKYDDWANEEEMRLIYFAFDEDEAKGNLKSFVNADGKKVKYIECPVFNPKEIIVGSKADDKKYKEIEEIAKKYGIPNVSRSNIKDDD
ncbi:MAG: tetratricopeptide repeat protein [Cycloclasticus sp.]